MAAAAQQDSEQALVREDDVRDHAVIATHRLRHLHVRPGLGVLHDAQPAGVAVERLHLEALAGSDDFGKPEPHSLRRLNELPLSIGEHVFDEPDRLLRASQRPVALRQGIRLATLQRRRIAKHGPVAALVDAAVGLAEDRGSIREPD